MLCSKESNPSSYRMESLNKSINPNGNETHPRFAAVSIKEKKLKTRAKLHNKYCIGELDGTLRKTKNHLPFL